MEIDCVEGMDVSTSAQAQDLQLADSVFTGSCGMVRAGSLRDDNHRQKARKNSESSRLWTMNENSRGSDASTTSVEAGQSYPRTRASVRRHLGQVFSGGMCYSRIVRADNFIPGKDVFEDWSRSINVSEDGTLYVIAYKSTRQIINVSVYSSNENFATFAYLDYPQNEYELILGVEEAGCNDMLFIGARPCGADFSEGATSIIAWRNKKFLCVLQCDTAPSGGRYYTNISESSSGALYFGCSDGAIEVWKPDSQGYVFVTHLRGHLAPVHKLVVDKFDTLYSVDVEDESNIRVWRNLEQVATVNLGFESVQTVACTNDGRLYVSTKRGEIMWRGMIDLLPGGAGPAITEVGLQRRPFLLPTNICCNISFAHRVETTKSDDSLVVLGSEILRPLYRPEGFVITNTCGCTILPRSEVMIMVTTEETFSIQAWYGNVCIAKLNTGLKFNQFQTLDCAKDGTLYGLVNDNIYIWKLV